MKVLEGLYYTKEHEWVKVEGNTAIVGITDYAQHALGDIVYVELPDLSSEFNMGDTLGTVESVKAASDIYSPVSGTVAEVNEELENDPAMVNNDPYSAWIAKIELTNPSEVSGLLNSSAYEDFLNKEDK